MSVKALRNLIKEYDSKDEVENEVEDDIIEDSEDSSESNEDSDEITVDDRETAIALIKSLMDEYNITVEEIL